MSGSVRFDDVADQYDRTRGISDEAMARTIELLAGELAGRGPVLEIGTGTGLLALPLHAAGIPVTGLDLSPPMLAKLVEKSGGERPFPLVIGDATRMGFADRVFGAAYLRWVLHLIPGWRDALAEAVRVIGPGGVVVVSLGAYDEVRHGMQQRFSEITGVSTTPVGLDWGDHATLDAEMARHGATLRVLPPVRVDWEGSPGAFLDEIEQGWFSWTWTIAEDVRKQAVGQMRQWAEGRFGALDRVMRYELATVWRAYDLRSRDPSPPLRRP
jgi:SAM-dependent methyltransferase